MKRSIPRSLLNATQAPRTEEAAAVERMAPSTGAGSAWKSGALAQSNDALVTSRKKLAEDILLGRHELKLMPEQVSDPLGTDRRGDWKRQEAYQSLVDSIAANGQDTPILVWPMDPTWQPDPLEPTKAYLTSHDEMLLQMLYDPRLKIGMTAEEARPIVKQMARALTAQAL
jgi:ParB family chromosome partitioning protein